MTQAEQILEVLRDGRWDTTRDILRAVPCIVHSRVSDLRRKGYRVEHRGHGGGADRNEYRLLPLDETPSLTPIGVSSSGIESGRTPIAASAEAAVSSLPVPLVLFDEAAA